MRACPPGLVGSDTSGGGGASGEGDEMGCASFETATVGAGVAFAVFGDRPVAQMTAEAMAMRTRQRKARRARVNKSLL